MQIFLTIVSGVAVYILGQLILQFVLEPIKGFNKERGDASFLLLSARPQIANASNTDSVKQIEMKEVASELIAKMHQIPFYGFISVLFGLPRRAQVVEACQEIVGLSHGVGPAGKGSPADNLKAAARIGHLLKIRTSFDLS